jgi:dinuclear metal center YbgI/SA1388 family protein
VKNQIRTVKEVMKALSALAPLQCSESWDNVGLLVGRAQSKVKSAVVCIDFTEKALDVAVKKGANLIINHHPCIFPVSKGLSKVVDDESAASSALIHRASRLGISVAAYHTNFDQCALEVVKTVSHGLGVMPRGRLLDHPVGSLTKLVVFVPTSHVETVQLALSKAGAGHIGNYDSCTFGAEGKGTFRGSKDTRPFLGKSGQLTKVPEVRLETILPVGLEKEVLKALFEAHPYEEVAYDLYAVKQAPASLGIVRGLGYGFWGEYSRARPFSDVCKDVRKLFNVEGFWLAEPNLAHAGRGGTSSIKKLAFVAGKGTSFMKSALAMGCDLFITGEAGYHAVLDAKRKGMGVIELGHRESERFFVTTMEGWLSDLGIRSYAVDDVTQKISVSANTRTSGGKK